VASRVLHATQTPDPFAPPSASWRWDGTSWSPTYVGFSPGFDKLVGSVDQGFGTRTLSESEVDPDFHPTYEIVDGEILEIVPPAADIRIFNTELFVIDGQEQLWIATESGGFFPDAENDLFARVDGIWVDRQPPALDALALTMTQGGERVFVNFNVPSSANATWMFEDDQWIDISNPLDNSRASSMAATGPNQLWATQPSGPENPEDLYFWDGVEWHYAKDLWPELSGYEDWRSLDAVGPDDLWMATTRSFEPENVAHWDGQSWTILATPTLLHGWSNGTGVVAASDGAFILDGIRLWRYESCAP
jgi:hypothetical protein